MTDDLVERLRETSWGDDVTDTLTRWDNARRDAADRIEAQAKLIEALRAGLEFIEYVGYVDHHSGNANFAYLQSLATDLLASIKELNP
jgi:hypothetical protein